MPKVKDTQGSFIEFQVWCSICGAGICPNTRYKEGTDNQFITHCHTCSKQAAELEDLVDRLERQVAELEHRLYQEQHENLSLREAVAELERYTHNKSA